MTSSRPFHTPRARFLLGIFTVEICIFSAFPLIYGASAIIGLLDLCLPFGVCLFAIVVKGENYCNVMPACVCVVFAYRSEAVKTPMNIVSAGIEKEYRMKSGRKERMGGAVPSFVKVSILISPMTFYCHFIHH